MQYLSLVFALLNSGIKGYPQDTLKPGIYSGKDAYRKNSPSPGTNSLPEKFHPKKDASSGRAGAIVS